MPSTAAPVLVTKPGEEGTLSRISEARSAGGFLSERRAVVVKVRLDYQTVNMQPSGNVERQYLARQTCGRSSEAVQIMD